MSVHDKTYKKTCGISKVSDQSAYLGSLIRIFHVPVGFLQPPDYPKRDKGELAMVDIQADLSLCWSHRSYCRFCRVLAHIYLKASRLIYAVCIHVCPEIPVFQTQIRCLRTLILCNSFLICMREYSKKSCFINDSR